MSETIRTYYQFVFPDGTTVGPSFETLEWVREISKGWPEDYHRGSTLYEYTLSRKPYEAGS